MEASKHGGFLRTGGCKWRFRRLAGGWLAVKDGELRAVGYGRGLALQEATPALPPLSAYLGKLGFVLWGQSANSAARYPPRNLLEQRLIGVSHTSMAG